MLVYLSLGSNLGDRRNYLQSAVADLAKKGVGILRTASLYSTEPKGLAAQPWFLNTIVETSTSEEPEALLDICLEIERSYGRVRVERDGPRTLDIDIILYGDRVLHSSRLTVPHPRYADRRFVLEPLAEIGPDIIDPVRHRTMRELLADCSDHAGVERVAPPLL